MSSSEEHGKKDSTEPTTKSSPEGRKPLLHEMPGARLGTGADGLVTLRFRPGNWINSFFDEPSEVRLERQRLVKERLRREAAERRAAEQQAAEQREDS
jgi:hypothetical protein